MCSTRSCLPLHSCRVPRGHYVGNSSARRSEIIRESARENSASDISSLLGFLRAINRRYQSTTWPSAPGAISASPCAAPPICMPGPTPPAIWCGAPTTVCNSLSSTAPLPHQTPCCCASQAALTSRSRCSSTVLPPRHPRSPRRCAPLSAAPASRSPGPPCVNACASTTPVSVSPSKLSNSAASSSAAPTAGTCQPDPHRRLPTRSHPATVPLFHRSAPGTHSERNDHLPHSAPSIVQLTSAGGAQRNTTCAAAAATAASSASPRP